MAYQTFDSIGILYPRSNLGWYTLKIKVDANCKITQTLPAVFVNGKISSKLYVLKKINKTKVIIAPTLGIPVSVR